EPLQLVHDDAEVALGIDDLRGFGEADQEGHIAAWLERDRYTPFELTTPGLLRFHVHRRTDATFQLTLTEHHVILDGWSVVALLSELLQTYVLLLDGKAIAPQSEPETSFRDFVMLELETADSEEGRAFWSALLDEAPQSRLPRDAAANARARCERSLWLAPEAT